MKFTWDWAYALECTPLILSAIQITISATLIGMTIAIVGGLILALLRRGQLRVITAPTALFIEFVRGTPLLIQIYFLFYVLPEVGVTLSPFLTGVIALGVHYSAYTSEVYRAGIDSVAKGQWEAARALSLSPSRTWTSIILPQAFPPIIPALGNYFVAMFKDTPLLSTITVLEILYVARDIGSESFRYLEPLTIVGVIFLTLSLIASQLVRLAERKLRLP